MTKNTTSVSTDVADQLLHDLVATPSITREEEAAVQMLVEWMAANGYEQTFRDEAGNAVGIIGQGDGTQDIILLGHIDTFPGTPPVYLDGDRLYGRGSVDAKGPLATFAVVGANLAGSLPPNRRVIVIGAVEEESATSAGANFAADQYAPKACVIGEPSSWDRITLGYKGRLIIRWRWEGPLAHSAGEAPTAAELAFDYWRDIQTIVAAENGETRSIFATLDASIRGMNTGTSQNGTYQWAEMEVGFRLPPNMTPDAVMSKVLAVKTPGEITVAGREETFVAEKQTPIARALRGAIRGERGKPRFVHKTGTSDMNIVGPRWKCPIVAYGPGDSALDHTPNEHIELPEYHRAIRVLTSAITRLAQEI